MADSDKGANNQSANDAPDEPTRKTRVKLSHELAAERAIMVHEMIQNGKSHIDIKRACLQQYNSEMGHASIKAMRENRYVGPGQEYINKPRQAHTSDSAATATSHDRDLVLLRQILANCAKSMRRVGVTFATIDAKTSKAKVEINMSQNWDL